MASIRMRFLVSFVFVTSCAQMVQALDYYIPNAFNVPIGQEVGSPWHKGGDVLYRADTGEVTYKVDDIYSWWPPDFASRSGILLEAQAGGAGRHQLVNDVIIQQVKVSGSNSLQLHFDPNSYWPAPLYDPRVQAIWEPLGMPLSYTYGKILPPRLSESFLRSDVYSFPLVNLVYVVPEPHDLSALLIGFVFLSAVRIRAITR